MSDLFHTPCILQAENNPGAAGRIVVGVRAYNMPGAEAGSVVPGLAMYTAGEHPFFIPGGKLTRRTDGTFVCTDARLKNRLGAAVRWRFAPLTLARWDEYRKTHTVVAGDEIRASFADDHALCNFYREEFLPPYWIERWERDKAEAAVG